MPTCKICKREIKYKGNQSFEDDKTHYCELKDYLGSFNMEDRLKSIPHPPRQHLNLIAKYLKKDEITGLKTIMRNNPKLQWRHWRRLLNLAEDRYMEQKI